MSTKIETAGQLDALLAKYDYYIFDCDGVIWLGDHILPFVVETLAMLKILNKTVYFVTNNSTKARTDYLDKFSKMGILEVAKENVFGLSYATAVYIDKILKVPKDKKVWVVGEKGIETELRELGYTTLGGTDPALLDARSHFDANHPALHNLDPDVGAVVVGLSLSINYLKLSVTLQYLLKDNRSIPFIATNIDSTFPSKGMTLIGAGSMVETLAFASGRRPDAICGKPDLSMMNSIKADCRGLNENPSRGLMIGDRLDTDMKFGRDGGLDTLLVLTGIEREDVVRSLSDTAPTYYVDKLGDLYELWSSKL